MSHLLVGRCARPIPYVKELLSAYLNGNPMTTPTDQVAEIIALYQSGMSQQAIGTALGLSQTWVGKILARNGIPSRHKAVSVETRHAFVQDYARGLTSRQIGQ